MTSKLDLFKEVKTLCDSFNCTISFDFSGDGSEVEGRHIRIDLDEVYNEDKLWSLVFHELGHVWCWDNDKYYIYHNDSLPKKQMAKYMRKYGLKAERYVDSVGMRLAKEHGFDFNYIKCYDSKEDIQWYRDWVEKEYSL